jgi:hypothetical protein
MAVVRLVDPARRSAEVTSVIDVVERTSLNWLKVHREGRFGHG